MRRELCVTQYVRPGLTVYANKGGGRRRDISFDQARVATSYGGIYTDCRRRWCSGGAWGLVCGSEAFPVCQSPSLAGQTSLRHQLGLEKDVVGFRFNAPS